MYYYSYIYYYYYSDFKLPGGDQPYMTQFTLNKTSAELWLGPSLDRETIQTVDLVIKATQDCDTGYWDHEENRNEAWNVSDITQLLVRVVLLDINDNPPTFAKDWFTAGVTRDTQYGEPVIDLSVSTLCSFVFILDFQVFC